MKAFVDNAILFLNAVICTLMRAWQDLLDTFNTDGGHIFWLIVFILISNRFKVMENHIELFIGALLGYLKGAGSNKTRRDRPVPTTETTAATVTTTASTEVKE